MGVGCAPIPGTGEDRSMMRPMRTKCRTSGRRGRLVTLLAVVVTSLSAAACGTNRGTRLPPVGESVGADSLESLRTSAFQLVGEPACQDASQCRSVAFGSKPCGGPSSYLVYSTQATDSAALAAVAERYRELQADANRALGRVSDCQVVPRPAVMCEGRRCTAGRP